MIKRVKRCLEKKFLLDKGLENNHKDIQKLSLKIVKENKISPVIIKSLFNTNKIICEEKLNEWVLTKIYTIPTDKRIRFFFLKIQKVL